MRALVGTYKSLMLLEDGVPTVLREGCHYGITWDHEYVYASYNPWHEDISRIEVYDSSLNYLDTLPLPVHIQIVHQIHWRDGILYITNTHCNSIEMWDGTHVTTWDYTDDAFRDKKRSDQYEGYELHINSIWTDGIHWYICEHGYLYPPAKIRVFDMGHNQVQVIEMDYMHETDNNAHNVYLEGEHMFVCRHRRIEIYDRAGRLVRRVYPHGDDTSTFLLRGLARTPEHFIIGESTEAPRELRGVGDSDILTLDDEFHILDSVMLKDAGQVYEIRVMDDVDYAHNGIPCPVK